MSKTICWKWTTVGVAAALVAVLWGVIVAPSAYAQTDASTPSRTVTLHASEDAFVNQAKPAQNYASGPLLVRAGQGKNALALVKFDLSGLPSGVTVTDAKLRLYRGSAGPNAQAQTGAATTPWAEATVNWNNKPTTQFAGSPPTDDAITGSYSEFTVTPLVTAWLVVLQLSVETRYLWENGQSASLWAANT